MFLTEQHYKKLNKLYYHGQVFKDRDSSVTDYSCYYLTTDPFYAYQYSGPDGYIKIHRLKKSLNICNLKSKQDRLTVENYCRKNKLKNPLIQLDILSEEDWLTHFQNNKNREDFILILKELNYDGFFNVEIEDKIRGRILRSDESLGFPAIGIFDESNLITIQTIHGFENILKLPDIQKIHEKEKRHFQKELYFIYKKFNKLPQVEVNSLIKDFEKNCHSIIQSGEILGLLNNFNPVEEQEKYENAKHLARTRLLERSGSVTFLKKLVDNIYTRL